MNENLIGLIEQAGIVGAGGAGFPTHVKLKAQADTVIINGAECEPLLGTDRWLMRHRAGDIVEAAAALANADDFIRRLPQGYDTVIAEDGGSLSQGQKQLLSIARVMLCLPPMLILDEATSSIDTRTEAMVQAGMDGLMKGRTTFVIAHRLSTIRNSDVIEVMDHGQIIERGAHDELLNNKGIYYALYTGALELD